MNYLSAEQILFIHDRLIQETGGMHGLRDINGLLSALGRAASGMKNQEFYPDIFSKAAALMDSLIRNHPFIDGNKRTGVAAAALFMSGNGYDLNATDEEIEIITMAIARSERTLEQLASWLSKHAEERD